MSIHNKLNPKQPTAEKVMFQGRIDPKLKSACIKELSKQNVTIGEFLEAAIKTFLDEKTIKQK